MSLKYKLIPLHERFQLLDKCCELLNTEWKKSYGIRSRSLNQSCDSLPCNLLMIHEEQGNTSLIGHSRLTEVIGEPTSIFLTSVIIQPSKRGLGLGKLLMSLTEQYALNMGYTTVCLSTEDKLEFYIKCGYVESGPVEQCVGKQLQNKILQLKNGTSHSIQSNAHNSTSQLMEHNSTNQTLEHNNSTVQPMEHTSSVSPNIPPPPKLKMLQTKINKNMRKFWMRKVLT
ncbi:N-alpha-acetyltransferase 80 [Ciona intestinalis]